MFAAPKLNRAAIDTATLLFAPASAKLTAMSATPVQNDLMLWSALRTRRRRVVQHQGIDAFANRWIAKARHARIRLPYLRKEAQWVVDREKQWADLTDQQLNDRMVEVRAVFSRRQQQTDHLREAFGIVREVAARETGERPYLVQMMGAMALYHGQIIEMATGEGKTLTASLGASVLGWLRRPVHVVTANDYLAERDANTRQPIYRRCGLRAGSVIGDTPPQDRSSIYRMPLVYLTQKELVADWLRDQLALSPASTLTDPVSTRWRTASHFGRRRHPGVLVPGLAVALIDELDALLIDEAVTPLIIAQPREEDAQAPLYHRARELALQLKHGEHFKIVASERRTELYSAGREQLDHLLREEEHGIWRAHRRREELVEQALTAEHCYHNGQQYQILDDKIVIVDEYTGRFMEDRTWQHGLHQAVEAKHDLEVTADRDTLASLSFQRFFRMYPHLCGMTGTAADAAVELETTYGLPVRVIPTNRPLKRERLPDLIYVNASLKWQAVVEDIATAHRAGRPVLVGTRSVEASEHLSALLTDRNLSHQVLNAVHHKQEAEIVTDAGQPGAIMVATNMAGRGTDIKLGPGVAEAGGLHVILTERHGASRVDRQLFGRAGRQGDPGSVRCIIALDDDLVLKHAARPAAILRRRYAGRSGPLPRGLAKLFDWAQRRASRQAFRSRAQVLRHDEELDDSLPR